MIQAPTGECCPACGSRQWTPLYRGTDRLYGTTDREFSIVECSSCRLMRLYPWPRLDEIGSYYPENYWFSPQETTVSYLEETYRRVVLRDHVQFVKGALGKPDEPVLDVGCGGALFGKLLAGHGYKVMGLDYSTQAARIAWKQNGVPVVTGDFAREPFPERSFGAVTMFHVLEHLYDPSSYIQAAFRLLKPGGRLILQVPNAACWQLLLFGEHWNGLDVPRHLVDFRASDIRSLVELHGFEVLRTKYFSLRDNPAGVASSLVPDLDPMARRIRKAQESPRVRLLKNLIYFGLVVAALPFTALEAACRAGSTVMLDARKPA